MAQPAGAVNWRHSLVVVPARRVRPVLVRASMEKMRVRVVALALTQRGGGPALVGGEDELGGCTAGAAACEDRAVGEGHADGVEAGTTSEGEAGGTRRRGPGGEHGGVG
ncbi:predicted protein [Verticillium alfalfae VaMs.102]|uniref:Predicted protein n=1 Tax=Verticillium alfalfae (strain VaMs.102 / ATCC MYA-4576 / FGSC 10136) TaxID=526221 RepID=C9SCK5_VERA1|nr:predicted protein [Verticillium alfalfae VaMs.102]EEY16820.1 predicted protein [Verticillium alfalfae VaMs.102]